MSRVSQPRKLLKKKKKKNLQNFFNSIACFIITVDCRTEHLHDVSLVYWRIFLKKIYIYYITNVTDK